MHCVGGKEVVILGSQWPAEMADMDVAMQFFQNWVVWVDLSIRSIRSTIAVVEEIDM